MPRLLDALEGKVAEYWRRFSTRVLEVGAVGWTPEGRQMCEALGLIRRGVDQNEFPVYSLAVNDSKVLKGKLAGLPYRLKMIYQSSDRVKAASEAVIASRTD